MVQKAINVSSKINYFMSCIIFPDSFLCVFSRGRPKQIFYRRNSVAVCCSGDLGCYYSKTFWDTYCSWSYHMSGLKCFGIFLYRFRQKMYS